MTKMNFGVYQELGEISSSAALHFADNHRSSHARELFQRDSITAIGLVVGVWCASGVPSDAPLSKHGPLAKFLFALILPAMVYFFFVFYGGQKAAHKRKPKTSGEIADLIERFLNDTSLYPQEFNDFVDCSHPDKILDSYRRRCEALDPRDPKTSEELRTMVQELRQLGS